MGAAGGGNPKNDRCIRQSLTLQDSSPPNEGRKSPPKARRFIKSVRSNEAKQASEEAQNAASKPNEERESRDGRPADSAPVCPVEQPPVKRSRYDDSDAPDAVDILKQHSNDLSSQGMERSHALHYTQHDPCSTDMVGQHSHTVKREAFASAAH